MVSISIYSKKEKMESFRNVINNLKALGAEVDVISVIGECDISKKVELLLDRIKVDTTYLSKESGRITSKKSRVIASQHQVLRFDHEKIESISTKSQKDIFNRCGTSCRHALAPKRPPSDALWEQKGIRLLGLI